MASFLGRFWGTLIEMSPYLLFGFAVAGLLSVLISPKTVERHLGRGRVLPTVKAALFGVPLPLCSCSVIPVAVSLRRHGATRGATTSFLISAPETGVDSIFVTYSLLGPVFAVVRVVAAFFSGIVGGLAMLLLGEDRPPAPETSGVTGGETCCCAAHDRKQPWYRRAWEHGFVTLPRDLANALIVGLIVAAAISAAVPPDLLAGGRGGGFVTKLIMLAVGIPIYVCATASVPVAAALIGIGVSPGAALVFLMSGPATNAATITTVWQFMGKAAAGIYLAAVALTALGFGVLLDLIYSRVEIPPLPTSHDMLPHWFMVICAVALVAVLTAAKLPGRTRRRA